MKGMEQSNILGEQIAAYIPTIAIKKETHPQIYYNKATIQAQREDLKNSYKEKRTYLMK